MNTPSAASGPWREVMALIDEWLGADTARQPELLAHWRLREPQLYPRLLALIEADRAAESTQFLKADGEPAVTAGQQLGPWRLRERIGSGGMGEVWRAERSDGLYEAQAAIKLLHGRVSGTALQRARFAREGELLARLEHPHIARLLDAGMQSDGGRYLVLEFVAGEHLDTWCDAQQLDLRARVQLFLQLCEAVAFAHAHLVVHRDLKPANILVTPEGQVKLLDFGVAKLLDDTAADSELTRAAAAGLTPAYAAPEQLNGGAISTATDVYALGVLLFQLLSGQRPYPGGDRSPAQLLRHIVDTEPLRLSQVQPSPEAAEARGQTRARLAQQLRSDLAPIVARALRKEPAARYASVQAFAEDLRRFLAHEPVSARALHWRYLGSRFLRRHRWGVAAAGGMLLLLGAGVAATLHQATKAREQAARAQAEAAKAGAIKDFLLKSFNLAQMGSKVEGGGSATTVLQLIEQSGQELLHTKTLAPEARLELLGALGELHRVNGMTRQAEPLQREALALARQHFGPRSQQHVYALVERATNLAQTGQRAASNAAFDEAIALMAGDPEHEKGESYAFAIWYRGVNAFNADDNAKALRLFEQAAALCRQHRTQDPTLTAALHWQANVHARLDRFDAGEAALQEALRWAKTAERPEQSESMARLFLGDLQLRRGETEAAVAQYDHAARLLKGLDSGGRNSDRAVVLLNAARARHELGQRDAALADLQLARAIIQHHPGGEPGRRLADRAETAQLAMEVAEGDWAKALPRARALVALWPAGATASLLGNLLLLRAEAEWQGVQVGGSWEQARQAAEQALPIAESSGTDTLMARQARLVLAEVLAASAITRAQAQAALRQVLQPAPTDAASPPVRARQVQKARALATLARMAPDAASRQPLAAQGLALLGEPRTLRERWVQARLQEGRPPKS